MSFVHAKHLCESKDSMFLLLSFHTKTLELYQAVCSHGNHKVANVLTQHVDERQLMHAIKSECESESSQEELWRLMTSEPLGFFFFTQRLNRL